MVTSTLSTGTDPISKQPRAQSPYQLPYRVIDRDAAILEADTRRPGVVIVGAGRSRHDRLDLFESHDYEVWGLNAVPMRDREGRFRADRWFELHPVEAQTAQEMHWLRTCHVPFYMFMPRRSGVMTDVEKQIFNQSDMLRDHGVSEKLGRKGRNFIDPRECGLTERLVRYPLGRARRIRDFFTCTFAYQIALALMEGFEEIVLVGVDLAAGTQRERTVERACVEWWVGFAEGRGVKVTYPKGMLLTMHPFHYGASYWTEAAFTRHYCEALHEQEIAK
jgi:hypothetical protein